MLRGWQAAPQVRTAVTMKKHGQLSDARGIPPMFRWTASLITVLAMGEVARADNWPAFRGPTGQGHSAEKNVPWKWGPNENIRWKVPLPDAGSSTPVIWGDRIFLTQATAKSPWPPRGNLPAAPKRSLMCLHRQ